MDEGGIGPCTTSSGDLGLTWPPAKRLSPMWEGVRSELTLDYRAACSPFGFLLLSPKQNLVSPQQDQESSHPVFSSPRGSGAMLSLCVEGKTGDIFSLDVTR